jgi:hypothetical protein
MAALLASFSLMRALFLEKLLDGGGKMWSGVHLPCRWRRVLAVWRIGYLVTDKA